MVSTICHPDDLRPTEISHEVIRIIQYHLSKPSRWLSKFNVVSHLHPQCHPKSPGWLSERWYLIRLSCGKFIMWSRWHTLPFLSHPVEIAVFVSFFYKSRWPVNASVWRCFDCDGTLYVCGKDASRCCFHDWPCLNIKTVLSTYGDFHVKDKTAVRTSYL